MGEKKTLSTVPMGWQRILQKSANTASNDYIFLQRAKGVGTNLRPLQNDCAGVWSITQHPLTYSGQKRYHSDILEIRPSRRYAPRFRGQKRLERLFGWLAPFGHECTKGVEYYSTPFCNSGQKRYHSDILEIRPSRRYAPRFRGQKRLERLFGWLAPFGHECTKGVEYYSTPFCNSGQKRYHSDILEIRSSRRYGLRIRGQKRLEGLFGWLAPFGHECTKGVGTNLRPLQHSGQKYCFSDILEKRPSRCYGLRIRGQKRLKRLFGGMAPFGNECTKGVGTNLRPLQNDCAGVWSITQHPLIYSGQKRYHSDIPEIRPSRRYALRIRGQKRLEGLFAKLMPLQNDCAGVWSITQHPSPIPDKNVITPTYWRYGHCSVMASVFAVRSARRGFWAGWLPSAMNVQRGLSTTPPPLQNTKQN